MNNRKIAFAIYNFLNEITEPSSELDYLNEQYKGYSFDYCKEDAKVEAIYELLFKKENERQTDCSLMKEQLERMKRWFEKRTNIDVPLYEQMKLIDKKMNHN